MPTNFDEKRRDNDTNEGGEARSRAHINHAEMREHHLDQTIEDSFPASDPPSTDPNPDGNE